MSYSLRATPIGLPMERGDRGTIAFRTQPATWSAAGLWSAGSLREFTGISGAAEPYRRIAREI